MNTCWLFKTFYQRQSLARLLVVTLPGWNPSGQGWRSCHFGPLLLIEFVHNSKSPPLAALALLSLSGKRRSVFMAENSQLTNSGVSNSGFCLIHLPLVLPKWLEVSTSGVPNSVSPMQPKPVRRCYGRKLRRSDNAGRKGMYVIEVGQIQLQRDGIWIFLLIINRQAGFMYYR